jgi:hypothetical protein
VKYKHILGVIHDLGDSFISGMNYVDDRHIVEDLWEIRARGADVEIDWLAGTFEPAQEATSRITESIARYRNTLAERFQASGVEISTIKSLKFRWPARGRKFMVAIDDHGKEHKIYVRESK